MTKISTQPYKGTRDFYPADKRLQKYIFNTWRNVIERYGYEEYDAPIIEPIEIYLSKTSQEIISEQVYNFKDRGDRQVVLRPEMTPSFSRLVAKKRQELDYPIRWYSIPNLWRYERPQRGRLREHWQLNVDIVGIKDVHAELELISIVDDIFKLFGADESMYEIRVNHRGLVNFCLKELFKFNDKTNLQLIRLIDHIHKISKTDFIKAIDDLLSDDDKEAGKTVELLNILETKQLNDLPPIIKATKFYEDLDKLFKGLTSQGINNVVYDASIMRGFDYYTGIVFEVFDNDPTNNRSMMGGGRYDGLIGQYGVSPAPTVGFGLGDVTMENFLNGHHLIPDLSSETEIGILLIDDVYHGSLKLINQLRSAGFNCVVDFSDKKLADKLKTANKKKLKYVIIVGETELKTAKYQFKNLKLQTSEELSISQIITKLKSVQ